MLLPVPITSCLALYKRPKGFNNNTHTLARVHTHTHTHTHTHKR